MIRLFRIFSIVLILNLFQHLTTSAFAIYDPLSAPNNKIGVHILSPDEISSAAKLVNNNNENASWGYVTVPIQTTDRNREKWLRFMIKARELQVIPIIRIATSLTGSTWDEPNSNDLLDFANFLNDLPWPIKNRYVIIFNEVNRADEFGGSISPEKYTDILNNAIGIFKSRSDQFFILPAGLDNAAPNAKNYIATPQFLARMHERDPEIFNKIDGWVSHAYPNPGFKAKPHEFGINKVDSFKTDLKLLQKYTQKKLPVFITETGWSNLSIKPNTIAEYFRHALVNTWNHDQIVTVTPFLLHAGTLPFSQFSLIDKNNQPTPAYKVLQSFAKFGSPQFDPLPTPPEVPPPAPIPTTSYASVEVIQTPQPIHDKNILQVIIEKLTNFFFPAPKNKQIQVGKKIYFVEVADNLISRTKGLSKHPPLKPLQGMLFLFDKPGNYAFWMIDMDYDIDIVWIHSNIVVGVTRGDHTKPRNLLYPPSDVDQVLEVNPESGINIGDQIKIID